MKGFREALCAMDVWKEAGSLARDGLLLAETAFKQPLFAEMKQGQRPALGMETIRNRLHPLVRLPDILLSEEKAVFVAVEAPLAGVDSENVVADIAVVAGHTCFDVVAAQTAGKQ